MKQTEIAATTQRKPSKLVAIISAAVLAFAIIASIILGIVMPKSSVLAAPSGNIKSVAVVGEDVYLATTDSKITRMDKDGEVKLSIDLAKETGLSVGEVSSVQTQTGTENVWAYTAGGYLFRLQEKDGKLNVLDYVTLPGGMAAITEKNNYVYVIERVGSFGCLKKFDLTAPTLNEGLVSQGHLYLPTQEGFDGDIVLEPANHLAIQSFEIFEREGKEYAYIVHADGLLRFDTACSQNQWKIWYDEKFNEAYPVALQAAVDAAVAAAEANGTTADSNALKEDALIKSQAKKSANEKAVAALTSKGLLSYDHDTGEMKIAYANFDKNLYNAYSAKDVAYRGCAYVEAEDRYYIVTQGFTMITCDAGQSFASANESRPAGIAPFKHEETDIKLPYRPEATYNAFFFSKDSNVGYIVYTEERAVSRVDLTKKELTFTANLEFDIRSIVQTADGENFFYMYTNAYEGSLGQYILRTSSIKGRSAQNALEALLTISIVLAVCAAITGIFALLCLYKRGFSGKFMDVMYGFKKQWVIYTIILATMGLVAMFCFYPAIGSISLSFFDYTEQKKVRLWNGFAHYKYIFLSEGALKEFGNMFFFLASDLFTALAPPLVFAFFLTIMRNKNYSALTRTLLFIPGIIPGVATTLLWREGIYGEYGAINNFIGFLTGANPKIEFLTDYKPVKWSLIMMGFPFVGSYLIFYGAMMNVPDSYYEAAEMDGISVIKRFIFIDIPLIFAQIKYVLIMTFIASVQNFGRTYMTETDTWGAKTPVHTMYDYVTKGNYGRASAYATVLFIFLFIATMLNMRISTKDNQVA